MPGRKVRGSVKFRYGNDSVRSERAGGARLIAAKCERPLMRFDKPLVVVIALCVVSGAATSAQAADPPRVAFFGFTMINTSLEPTKPEEEARLRMLDEVLRTRLDASGRFTLVAVSPELQREIARGAGDPRLQRLRTELRAKSGRRLGRLGYGPESQQPHSQHQPLPRGRADREARVCQKRRHPRQHRRILAPRPRLHAAPLFVRAAVGGFRLAHPACGRRSI